MLLGDLSEEEREAAVQYYEDYFADAGPEMEDQIIQELGSPEKVALMIREGLRGENAGDEYAETGFSQTRYDDRKMPVDYTKPGEEASDRKPWTSRTLKIILIILIICVGCSAVIPAVSGIICGILGIIAGMFGIFFAFVIVSFCVAIAGGGLVIAGITTMFSAFPCRTFDLRNRPFDPGGRDPACGGQHPPVQYNGSGGVPFPGIDRKTDFLWKKGACLR